MTTATRTFQGLDAGELREQIASELAEASSGPEWLLPIATFQRMHRQIVTLARMIGEASWDVWLQVQEDARLLREQDPLL